MKFNHQDFQQIRRYIRCGSFRDINKATTETINFSNILTYDDFHNWIKYSTANIHTFNMLRWDYIVDEFATNDEQLTNKLPLIKKLINRVYTDNEKQLLKFLAAIAYIRNQIDDDDWNDNRTYEEWYFQNMLEDTLDEINERFNISTTHSIEPAADEILRLTTDTIADMYSEIMNFDDESD